MTNDGTMIGRICHIEAALPDGQRFNEAMTNEERRSYENLILLCGDHHTIIDDNPNKYTIEKLRRLKNDHEKARSAVANTLKIRSAEQMEIWEELAFSEVRDLRPALMGRSLGPADAAACPELAETAILLRDLEAAYSTRLAGVPGAGKSVCVMQVAYILKQRGWHVLRARNPAVGRLPFLTSEASVLYIVDDAHLTPAHVLNMAEQATGPNAWLLTTFNTAHSQIDAPGTTHIDPKRAVRTIANKLRAQRATTLEIVSKADTSVGDRPFEESLERRIDAAEKADVPWQFCFILGGGWTRADAIASSAISVGADSVLAAIAARQIASRDEQATRTEIDQIVQCLELDPEAVDQTITWLIKHRLISGRGDLRTPHQRFAAVLLRQLLKHAAEAKNTQALEAVINAVIGDDCYPLIGLRNLLQELRFGIGNWRFHWFVKQQHREMLVSRCWAQRSEEERNHACLLLCELECYFDDWLANIINDDGAKLTRWINDASGQSAYGTGYLLGQLSLKDEGLAKKVTSRVDLTSLAKKLSDVTPDQVYAMTELVSNVARSDWDTWNKNFIDLLDKDKLRSLASNWPDDAYLSSFANLCAHLTYHDQPFGLELVMIFTTGVAHRLRADPVGSFHEMDDIFWHALRLHDPLGIYVGKKRATGQMKEVGKRIAKTWSIDDLAAKISRCQMRDMQSAAGLLLLIRKVDQKRFTQIVKQLDWNIIEATLEPHLDDLFHDADVFLSVCGMVASAQRAVSLILKRHQDKITILTPRLAYTAPDFSDKFVEMGGLIGVSTSHHFYWDWAAILLARWAKDRPDLIDSFLAPHISNAATRLSQKHASWYEEAILFLRLVQQLNRKRFEEILSLIDAETAEVGWTNALRGKTSAQHTVAYLIHFSLKRSDALGSAARRLRQFFPKSSVPPEKLLKEFK
ncbi:hypothetical protein [Novosphingobium beihaiensis]|uniref:HNH endonuclease n=1 Tax=Novosphingobium beihaiensis TaxID=2930389 RepID=A0ABT0BS50_9SPHN|nr:hypothetical protein [Novosphingobium beihaiensis]MCJ2187885.1 hypothetical protein [Novosphingobium beihaiensis]